MPSLEDAAEAIAKIIQPTDAASRQRLSGQWRQELLQGFLRGDLRMYYTDDRRPIHSALPGAMVAALTRGAVTVRELNRWLALIGTDVVVAEISFAKAVTPRRYASTHEAVQQAAHRLADAWARQYFDSTDLPPTEAQVVKAIRKELNDEFGKCWSDKTIRRHCLEKWQFSPLVESAQIAQD